MTWVSLFNISDPLGNLNNYNRYKPNALYIYSIQIFLCIKFSCICKEDILLSQQKKIQDWTIRNMDFKFVERGTKSVNFCEMKSMYN